MKRLRLIITLLLLKPFGALADYGYRSLSETIAKSDYGVLGKIVKLDTDYFYIEVHKYLLGKMQADTLAINKFVDYGCGKRHSPYKVGQQEVVFFNKTDNVSQEFELYGYGGGDEFELLISGDSLSYQKSIGLLEKFELKSFLGVIKLYDSLINRSNNATSEQRHQLKNMLKKSTPLGEQLGECADAKELKKIEKVKREKQNFPKPSICFGNCQTDSIPLKSYTLPFFQYSDKSNKAEFAERNFYCLLSCNYTIISNGKKEKFRIRGWRATISMSNRIRQLNPGDQVLLDDISILYPNNKSMKYEDVSIFVGHTN